MSTYTPLLCREQHEGMSNSQGASAPDLATLIHISAPVLSSRLKKHFDTMHSCRLVRTPCSGLSHRSAVLCIHRRFHSCTRSDAQCHLKLNSGENQYDKLLLVLALNCFSLEIDTGAGAIHHLLKEVGALRENSRASVWSGSKKEKGKCDGCYCAVGEKRR